MRQVGCAIQFQLTDLAVMGVLRVLPLLWKFITLVHRAGRLFEADRPDAVVLVDFPGFNWWIARKARRAGIPVFYYMPPQLWAWASWRIRRVRKYVDCVLCALPFEYDWYRQRGVHCHDVGHPFFDEVAETALDQDFVHELVSRPDTVVGLLPGSRNQEVQRNWPLLHEVARRLHARFPHTTFEVACYKSEHRGWCRSWCDSQSQTTDGDQLKMLPLTFHVGRTSEVIESADCCLMTSGSVSLEMLARGTPAIVIYSCSRLLHWLGRHLTQLESITLPNLISGETLYPERVCSGSSEPHVQWATDQLIEWCAQPSELQAMRQRIAELRDRVVRTGASRRAADVILQELGSPHPKAAPADAA